MGSDQSAVRSWQGSDLIGDWLLPISELVWVRSVIQPDFDSTTQIYLINLLWKLGLGLGLDSELHFLAFCTKNDENEHLIFCEFHEWYNILLKERNQAIRNKIQIAYSKSVRK